MKKIFLVMVAMFVLGGVANATYVDFTSFSVPANQSTVTAVGALWGSIDVTLTALPTASGKVLTKSSTEGIGINSLLVPNVTDDPGEIDNFYLATDELLKVSFSQIATLDYFTVSQLQFNTKVVPILGDIGEKEYGQYSFNGTDFFNFAGIQNGIDQIISLGTPVSTNAIYFSGAIAGSDFSVKGVSAVPEPVSMLLFGTGLIGIGGYARRIFKK